MTVYVDGMRAPYGRMIMCHMIADDEAELHAMAYRIGVARRWYQGDHYDISLGKRALAVGFGAVEITRRQAGAMTALRRYGLDMGAPADAVGRLRLVIRAKRGAPANPIRRGEIFAEADCEDQALAATDVCLNWKCQDGFAAAGEPRRPKLVKRERFWVCPKCGGSYGESPHPDLKGEADAGGPP